MHRDKGFTLIELVIVIVLLGILAAVALPRFMDLSGDAHIASVNSSAAALSVGINLAHSKYLIDPTTTDFDGDGTADLTFDSTTKWPYQYQGNAFTGSATACQGLWNTVLTASGATVATSTASAPDYVAVNSAGTPAGCKFQYRKNVGSTDAATYVIKYDETTGAVTVSSP